MPHAVLLTRIRTDNEMDRRRKQRSEMKLENQSWVKILILKIKKYVNTPPSSGETVEDKYET